MQNINRLLAQADTLRFKLLAIVGQDQAKKEKVVQYLTDQNWLSVDVEQELLEVRDQLEKDDSYAEFQVGEKIKQWFKSKPNNLILTNQSILYHETFLKISPIGAFKYNSRNKNCVIFLEDERILGRRLSHGEIGSGDYYDQEINDILMVKIDDIDEAFTSVGEFGDRVSEPSDLDPDAIGKLFNYQEIKDVVDIDADIEDEANQQEIIKSYVISERLQNQIVDFFDNLEKTTHKAAKVIGNYGSGKSHLIAFLISLINTSKLSEFVSNPKIKESVSKINRQFLTVQFELQAGQVELKTWFFGKIRQQLKQKYNIEISDFDPKTQFDDKENISAILDIIKSEKGPSFGLLVVIDEISDFLAAKQKEPMKADIQFLRVIGQVCQAQDMMFVGSMQENIFTSPKFKNVAAEFGRVSERFQEIIIHKEDIKKVIATRIVAKEPRQRHKLESKLVPYAEKIEDVSRNIDVYVDLFPLTPFLIEMFSDLPYFEKRGVIQFAMKEIKTILNKPFPHFITFERIYDLLENNPNKKNLPEVFEIIKDVHILKQKIKLLDDKFQTGALKIVKALTVLSLWSQKEKGATAKELANNLMLLPEKKLFTAEDHISLIVKKIRDVTDGEYIKVVKDESTNVEYFKYKTGGGPDPEEKISQKVSSVSDSEVEHELFYQLADLLEILTVPGQTNVYDDECRWLSTKSFRRGYIAFYKDQAKFGKLPDRDYAIVFISPFAKKFQHQLAKNQLTIKIKLTSDEHLQQLKEIVAIKELIDNNQMKMIMQKKLDQRVNGFSQGNISITGLKFRLSKILITRTECALNGKAESIKNHLTRELTNLYEILDAFKESCFDELFNQAYPLHQKYTIQLTSTNIVQSLSPIAVDLARGNFNDLLPNTKRFLQSIDLLDSAEFPDTSNSKTALGLLSILKKNPQKVTTIQSELIEPFVQSEYGLEPEIIYLILVLLTVQGKIFLQLKGGEKININNIKEKLKSLAVFESIAYTKLQENYSYDFAERLLNALNLNGAKIKIEKERFPAFKEYKEKITLVLKDVKTLRDIVDYWSEKTSPLPMGEIKNELIAIEELDWQVLDIANHSQFGVIEAKLGSELSTIKLKIEQIKILTHALVEYQSSIHESLQYMEEALGMLETSNILVADTEKLKKLKTLHQEVLDIVSKHDKFIDRAHRNPALGKFQKFRQSYIYDFYHLAHEKYVGNKVGWKDLDSYSNHSVFQKLINLNKLSCISVTKFNQQVLDWSNLKKFKCIHPDLEDQLQRNVRCPRCGFPQSDQNYSQISAAIDSIESKLEQFYDEYSAAILKSIREYRDNLQFLDGDGEKSVNESILNSQKLPDVIDNVAINAINKLFKEIDIQEIDRDELIQTLFPNDQMITLEDLRKAFLNWETNLKKNKVESDIRIRLK